ncbi:MAG: dUTP diphosphatase [Patescibacteria group bacterium]
MAKVKVKKIKPAAIIPKYAQPGDAGLDICSCEDYSLRPGERHSFFTGLAFEFSEKYVGLVWDKGGMAHKHGIHCLAGVLDSSYRGELVIVLLNTSQQVHEIKTGDKIAQLLIQPVERAEIIETKTLSETARGEGRFGSTGR